MIYPTLKITPANNAYSPKKNKKQQKNRNPPVTTKETESERIRNSQSPEISLGNHMVKNVFGEIPEIVPTILIHHKSTLADLMNKFPSTDPEIIKDMFDINGRNPEITDLNIKEMLFGKDWPAYDVFPDGYFDESPLKIDKRKNGSKEKNDSTDSEPEESSSHDERVIIPKPPPEDYMDYPSQPVAKQKADWSNLREERNTLDGVYGGFREEDYYKGEEVSKKDISQIAQMMREGNKGVDKNEENYLQTQYCNDLMDLQCFIEFETNDLQKKKWNDRKEENMQVFTKDEFPDLNSISDNHSQSNQANILVQLEQQKKLKYGRGLIGFSQDEWSNRVRVRLDTRPSHSISIPFKEWKASVHDQFVLGNVLIYYPVRATGELLQAPQPVSRHNVQQAEVLLQ